MGKLEKIPAWNLTKVRSKKEVIDEARTTGAKVHFVCIINRHASFEKCWIGGRVPKIQSLSCFPWCYCERWFWSLRSFYRARIISISNDGSKKSWISYPDRRVAQDKQQTQYQLSQVKNGRCSEIIEISQIGVSRHLDSSTMTQLAKIMVQYGRPSRSCWAKSVRSFFGRPVMEKAIWETFIAARLGEGFQLGMLFRTPLKKHSSHLCMWVPSNWLERRKY